MKPPLGRVLAAESSCHSLDDFRLKSLNVHPKVVDLNSILFHNLIY